MKNKMAFLWLAVLICVLVCGCSDTSVLQQGQSESAVTSDASQSASVSADKDTEPVVLFIESNSATSQVVTLTGLIGKLAEKYNTANGGKIDIVSFTTEQGAPTDKTPDIVIYDYNNAPTTFSPYTEIASKNLADLTPYLENCADFKEADFVMPVLDAGKVGNQQFILPFFYAMPLLMGDNEISDIYGLPNGSDLKDYESFWSKLNNVKLEFPLFSESRTGEVDAEGIKPDFTFMTSGGSLVDIENGKLLFSEDYFKKPLELIKELYTASDMRSYAQAYTNVTIQSNLNEKSGLTYINVGGVSQYAEMIVTNQLLSENFFYGSVPYTANDTSGKHKAYINGGVGISESSPRKQAAFDFLMYCLLSDEAYTNPLGPNTQFFPVKRSVLESQCTETVEKLLSSYTEKGVGTMTAESLYNDIANIDFAHMCDLRIIKVMRDALKAPAGVATDTIIANLEQNWTEYDTGK